MDEPRPVPFDLKWMRSNYGDNDDMIRSLLEMFVERSAVLLDQMKASAASGDLDALGEDAHALKGISATVGAGEIAALMARPADVIARSMPQVMEAHARLLQSATEHMGVEAPTPTT